MSQVAADTVNNITGSLMKGHCFSSPTSQKNLIDVTDSICRELSEGPSAGSCRHLTEKLTDAHTLSTDSVLMSVNVLVNVLSPTNCRTLKYVQGRVVENAELFKALVFLLGCPNQLISHSACKALVYFLGSAGAINEKLEYIIKCSKQVDEDFKEDVKPETRYCQVLATFDLIRILCKQFHFHKSSQLMTSVCTCELKDGGHVIPFEGKCFENLQPLSNFVEYFTAVFHKHFGSDQEKVILCGGNSEEQPGKAGIQENQMPDWLELLDSWKKNILFVSYLKMAKSLLKRDKIHIVSINKMVHLFLEIFNAGIKLQRTSAKIIFDIVSDFLQRKQQEKIDVKHFQVTAARNICCVYRSGVFWENIPYHDGPLGFGGTEFTEKSEDQKGDLTLLRKLAKLYFVAVKILLECQKEDKTADFEIVTVSLSTLSKYMSCKLKLDLTQTDTKSEWLCRLILDGDDDAMIFILVTVLQIYVHLTELLNQDSQLQKLLISSNVMEMLSPHQLFWNYLKMFDFDPSLLLDLLISSETNFLQYFTSYLHCMRLEWEHCGVVFRKLEAEERHSEERYSESSSEEELTIPKRMRVEAGCIESVDSSSKKRQKTELTDVSLIQQENSVKHEHVVVMSGPGLLEGKSKADETFYENNDNEGVINPGLDQVLSVLIRLRMSVDRLQQKKMFPYTISPLIRLLVGIEELYEK